VNPFKRTIRIVAMATVAVSVGSGVADAAPDNSLVEARVATARYHNPAVAEAEGFVAFDGECVGDATGGMGVHHGRIDRLDGHLDAAEPEALLYEPRRGPDRLVGLEYVVVAPVDEPPSLFGQQFEQGPELGDGTAMWALHVWLWRHNPAGTFAPYNPNVSCPPAV
jgi:hypothetical protein